MNLLQQAASDLRVILEDSEGGFAQPVTVVSPRLQRVILNGIYRDIHFQIDPETAVPVSGRTASLVLSIDSLKQAFGELPRGISDPDTHPWVVELIDLQGVKQTYKISDTHPDQLGAVICTLEEFQWIRR